MKLVEPYNLFFRSLTSTRCKKVISEVYGFILSFSYMKNNNERLVEGGKSRGFTSTTHRWCQEKVVWTETFLKKEQKRRQETKKKAVDKSGQEVRGPEKLVVATGVRDSGSGRTHYVGDRRTKSAQAWMQINM